MIESGGQSDSRTANVQLTADIGPYTQQTQQAAVETNKLADAVDSLQKRLDGLVSRAGKKLTIVSAADIASLGAATAQAAAFEKQMSTLSATAAVTGRSFNSMKSTVNELARQFPMARSQAIELVETLTNLGVTGTKQINDLSKTFVKLGAATGESTAALASGLTELGRSMGNLQANTMDKYADTLLTLSKNAGVAATSVLNFAQSIQPAARAAGMTEKQILGISTAFTKAGADGFSAANTFNSMLNDITKSLQTGSPEIIKYSNLVGKTVDQFSKMDSAQQISEIFAAINKQGNNAVVTLNRLGFDGPRALKALQAVSQGGGMQKALADAGMAGDGSNLQKGSEAAMKGAADELEMMKNQFQQIGTTIGEVWLPPLTQVVHLFNKLLEQANTIGQVFLKIGSAFSGLAGVMGAGAGIAMQAMGPLALLGTMRYVNKSRPMASLKQGYADSSYDMDDASRKARLAGMTVSQRAGHFLGETIGDFKGRAMGDGGASPLSKAVGAPFRLGTMFANAQADFYGQAAGRTQDRPVSVVDKVGETFKGLWQPLGTSSRDLTQEQVKQGKALRGATAEAKSFAFALGKVGVQTTKAGAMGALDLAKGGAGAALSMINPVTAGLSAATMGFGMYQEAQSRQETANKSEVDASFGLSKYQDALGIATTATTSFATAIKAAEKALPVAPTVEGNLKVNPNDVAVAKTAGRTMDQPAVANIKNANEAVSYMMSLGAMDPGSSQKLKLDLIQSIGADETQKAFDMYLPQTQGGTVVDQSIGTSSLFQAATQRQNERGFMQKFVNPMNEGTDASNSLIQQAFNGLTTEGAAQTEFGPDYARLWSAQHLGSAFIQGTDRGQVDMKGNYTGGVDKTTAQQVARQTEQLLDTKDIGYNANGYQTPEELFKPGSAGFKAVEAKFGKGSVPYFLGQQKVSDADKQMNTPGTAGYNLVNAGPTIEGQTLGKFAQDNKTIQAATGPQSDNPNVQYQAMNTLLDQAKKVGGGFAEVDDALQQFKAGINDPSDKNYMVAVAAQQKLGAQRQDAMGYMGRDAQLGESMSGLRLANQALVDNPDDIEVQQRQEGAQQAAVQARQGYAAYLKQVVDFSRNYERAVDDRNLNLKRSEFDYQLSVTQSREDFYRSTLRSDKDFNRQMTRQAEDAAKSVYNPWQRTFAKYTTSTSSLHQNLADQNMRLQKQMKQLAYLKKMGLSQEAIDTLDLSSADNQQQVDQMVHDAKSGKGTSIGTINKDISKRKALTKDFVQNENNVDYRRAEADYKRAQARAEADFNRSADRAEAAHDRMLRRNAKDWKTQTQRGLEDLHRSGEGMFGGFQKLFNKATKSIGTNLGKLGDGVIADLDEIKTKYPELFDPSLTSTATPTPTGAGDGGTRYNPSSTQAHHRSAAGSIASVPTTMLIGEGSSPEGVFPLNASAHGFLASMYRGVSRELVQQARTSGYASKARGGGGNSYTSIDQSSTFRDITVMADDPNRMARELQDKAKLKKLRRPVAAGA